MFDSPDRLFSLALGLLTFAYALISLVRGRMHALRQSEGWALQTYTPESIITFPFILSAYITLAVLLALLGCGPAGLLFSRYLIFSGPPALIARLLAIWLLSYAVAFFLSQVRRLLR